jgi:hypothetical protein
MILSPLVIAGIVVGCIIVILTLIFIYKNKKNENEYQIRIRPELTNITTAEHNAYVKSLRGSEDQYHTPENSFHESTGDGKIKRMIRRRLLKF